MTTDPKPATRLGTDQQPHPIRPAPLSRQTVSERTAVIRSYEAQKAVRTLKAQLDATLDMWRARLNQLYADVDAARRAVGSDWTRPYYTDDLGKLHRQERRYRILADAVFSKEL